MRIVLKTDGCRMWCGGNVAGVSALNVPSVRLLPQYSPVLRSAHTEWLGCGNRRLGALSRATSFAAGRSH